MKQRVILIAAFIVYPFIALSKIIWLNIWLFLVITGTIVLLFPYPDTDYGSRDSYCEYLDNGRFKVSNKNGKIGIMNEAVVYDGDGNILGELNGVVVFHDNDDYGVLNSPWEIDENSKVEIIRADTINAKTHWDSDGFTELKYDKSANLLESIIRRSNTRLIRGD